VRHAEFVCGINPIFGGFDDLDLIGPHVDVAQQQGKVGLADAAEAEHPDVSVEPGPGLR
jgi:hypothetical protein